MARIVSLEDVDGKLRSTLSQSLRVCDSAIVLPQAHKSAESDTLKNVVVRLNGSEGGFDGNFFNANWFSGVSAVRIPNAKAESLLEPRKRREFLEKLKTAIPSEMADSQIQVGPALEGDERDRDTSEWVAGFDGPGCCVGLYSAMQSRSPEAGRTGMARLHREYYLIAKAGGGLAAQTFHARLCTALKKGLTLEEALSEGGEPGAQALRRVSAAAKRNRGRVLSQAAETLGIYTLETIGDSASPSKKNYRLAVCQFDVSYNALTRIQNNTGYAMYQYSAGAVDASVSHGLLTSSNVGEGFIGFTHSNGEDAFKLRNEAFNAIPFSTPRIMSNRDMVTVIAKKHMEARGRPNPHPDNAWINERFTWHSKDFGVDLEPPCLWGSHEAESFVSAWSRELGLSKASMVHMQPELVVLSAIEPGRLRVAAKAIQKA